jgi:hypothetical protein
MMLNVAPDFDQGLGSIYMEYHGYRRSQTSDKQVAIRFPVMTTSILDNRTYIFSNGTLFKTISLLMAGILYQWI